MPSAIRAGAAFVELYADDSQLVKGMRNAEAKIRAFGANLSRVGATFAAAGAAIVGPILAASKSFAAAGDQLDKMSARTGISVENLSRLKFAADQSGASLETVEAGVRRMQQTITGAAEGTGQAVDALGRLGVSASQLAGLSPEDQFTILADRIAQIEDPTARAAAAMDIFGKSGTQLLPMIADGAAGLEKFGKAADEIGVAMSTKDAKAAAALSDAMDRLQKTLGAVWQRVGAAVAETLTTYAEKLTAVAVKTRQFVDEHSEVVVAALKFGAVLAGVGTALAGVSAGFITATHTVATATAAVKVLNSAMMFLAAHPGVAAVAAIAAGAVILGRAIRQAGVEHAHLSKQMAEATSQAEAARKADLQRMAALQGLAGKQRLTTAEMDEAQRIVGELESRYGAMGVTVDRASGAVIGLAGAFEQLIAAMQRQAEADVLAEKAEIIGNERALRARAAAIRGGLAGTGITLGPLSDERELAKINSQLAENQARLQGVNAKLAAIREGTRGALVGEEAGVLPMLTGEIDLAAARADELAAYEQKLANDLADLKISLIEDAEARELAAIERKYAAEREKAKSLGADAFAFAAIDTAEKAEKAALGRRVAARREEEERQRDDRMAAIDEEIARSRIELTYEESDQTAADRRKKEMALIRLDEQKALRAAIEIEPDASLERLTEIGQKIREQFDLRRRLVAAQTAEAPTAIATRALGTFSAEQAAQFGRGDARQDRIANATEKTAENTRKLADAAKFGSLVWV